MRTAEHQLGAAATHFWLTRSVARVVGLSLSEAMAEGRLTPENYAQMVTRCRGCREAAACQAWLGLQAADASEPPPFCLHRDMMQRLAQRL